MVNNWFWLRDFESTGVREREICVCRHKCTVVGHSFSECIPSSLPHAMDAIAFFVRATLSKEEEIASVQQPRPGQSGDTEKKGAARA